jgi:hypothetical protein
MLESSFGDPHLTFCICRGAPARWYNDDVKWLKLKHVVYGTELKNFMERFIQKIKDRSECFDDNFPCRKIDCSTKYIYNWLKMYVFYLHFGMDRSKFIQLSRLMEDKLTQSVVNSTKYQIQSCFNSFSSKLLDQLSSFFYYQ